MQYICSSNKYIKLFFKVFNICFHNLFSIRYCVTAMTSIFQYYGNSNLWVFSRSKGYKPSVVVATCVFGSTGFSSYCNFTEYLPCLISIAPDVIALSDTTLSLSTTCALPLTENEAFVAVPERTTSHIISAIL